METETHTELQASPAGTKSHIGAEGAALLMQLGSISGQILARERMLETIYALDDPELNDQRMQIVQEAMQLEAESDNFITEYGHLMGNKQPLVSQSVKEVWPELNPDQDKEYMSQTIELAKIGDAEAFGVIYSRYAPDITRYLHRFTDPESAADIAQDAFIKAFRHIASFENYAGAGIRPWLYRIAYNAYVDSYRRKTKLNIVDTVDQMEHLVADDDPESTIVGRLVIASVLSKLVADHQDVMKCVVMGGEDPDDYALRVGISPKTVRTRIYRARVRLQQLREAGELSEVA